MDELRRSEAGNVALSRDRQLMCLEAVWELDALARVLPGLVPNIAEVDGAHYAVRGVAGRILRLSWVLMNALEDEAVATAKLRRVIELQEGQG